MIKLATGTKFHIIGIKKDTDFFFLVGGGDSHSIFKESSITKMKRGGETNLKTCPITEVTLK